MSASCATRRLRVSAPLPLGSTERQLEPVLVHLPRLGAHSKLPRTLDEMIQTLCAPLHVARVLARIFALYRRCELLQPQPDGAGRPIWVPQLDPRFILQNARTAPSACPKAEATSFITLMSACFAFCGLGLGPDSNLARALRKIFAGWQSGGQGCQTPTNFAAPKLP